MYSPPPFLGRGWAFPPTFSNGGAAVAVVADAEDIEQSLYILLTTRLGERIMREDFGSDLFTLQFEAVTNALVNNINNAVTTAILQYEARVDLLDVMVDQDDNDLTLLRIEIMYQIRGSNSRFNMVYPFYINEGNG